jgi:hypothetical protein
VGALDNYSLVFVIFINFFGQLKDWVGQVPFLVSCPKGQVKKYVNVEACRSRNSCVLFVFCLKLLIGLFLHSHHPLFHFISPVCYQLHSRLLLFNFIIVIYIHRGYCFMFWSLRQKRGGGVGRRDTRESRE